MKCGQQRCSGEAVLGFVWPASDPLPSCLPCALQAQGLAQHFGFQLPFVQIEWFEQRDARETVARLGGEIAP